MTAFWNVAATLIMTYKLATFHYSKCIQNEEVRQITPPEIRNKHLADPLNQLRRHAGTPRT